MPNVVMEEGSGYAVSMPLNGTIRPITIWLMAGGKIKMG